MVATEDIAHPQLAGFSLFDPDFLIDPYAMVARAHREAPVSGSRDQRLVITKYQTITSILSDSRRFSSRAVGRIPCPATSHPWRRIFAGTRSSSRSIPRAHARPAHAATRLHQKDIDGWPIMPTLSQSR